MSASGGRILQDFKEEIEKVTERHEHALGYAPGMDTLTMDDWSRLNQFLKTMRETYSDLSKKYAWQLGLATEDVNEINTKCYEQVKYSKKILEPDINDKFEACVKHEALIKQAQKGKPLNL